MNFLVINIERYTPRFKFQVVMEILSRTKAVGQIARSYGVHPVTLTHWKREFIEKGPEIFFQQTTVHEYEKRIEELENIGLTSEARDAGDAALAEAIELAERVLAIQLEYQGPDSPVGSKWIDLQGKPEEWWEVTAARLTVSHLNRLSTLTEGIS